MPKIKQSTNEKLAKKYLDKDFKDAMESDKIRKIEKLKVSKPVIVKFNPRNKLIPKSKTKQLTDEAIVKRCVELGVEGGKKWKSCDLDKTVEILEGCWVGVDDIEHGDFFSWNDIWTDLEWAKAVFGEKPKRCKQCKKKGCWAIEEDGGLTNWQYHLIELALASNRIDYMRKWLVENGKI